MERERHVLTHVAATALPLALADLHRSVPVDAPLDLVVDRPTMTRLVDLVLGAGFAIEEVSDELARARGAHRTARVRRLRSLADTVGPEMRLLVCGLNPSERAADAGVGFVTPGNRFWPAALTAGLVSRDRDPRCALVVDGVGMTDLVKRATPRAAELSADEYRARVARVDRLCDWLQPRAICMVGLAGWRAAVDRKAVPGWQETRFGGRPVYVMPSTSGLNASTSLGDLAEHLRRASGRT